MKNVLRNVGDQRRLSSTVQDLHCRFRTYGKNAREWMRKCVLMLPELERERVWEKKGYGSLSEYAGRLSGMSKEMVYEGLRVLRVVKDMPEIMRVIEKRGIGIVRPVLTLLTRENQSFWAEKMRVMSKQTITLYRQEWERAHIGAPVSPSMSSSDILRPGSEITINSPQQEAIGKTDHVAASTMSQEEIGHLCTPSSKQIVGMELSSSTIDRLTKLKGDGEWDTLMNELMNLRETLLEEEKPPEKHTSSRHIPVAIERFVIERSRGVCEVGACRNKYTMLHHVQRFASEQVHDPDRIIALCKSHERLVHLGLIEDESISPHQWKILEKADKSDKKYLVDQMVQKYRRPE